MKLENGGEAQTSESVSVNDLLPSPRLGGDSPDDPELPSSDEESSSWSDGDPKDGVLSGAIEAATGRSDLARRIEKKEKKDAEERQENLPKRELGKLTMEMMLEGIDGTKGMTDLDRDGNLGDKLAVGAPEQRYKKQCMERDVAYDITKAELSRWTPQIRKMRNERTLNFPMNRPTTHLQPSSTTLATQARAGENEFEDEIREMLQEANVVAGDKDIEQLEEVNAERLRQKERERARKLARMRREMGHYERKMKRMKRIKSKRYRKGLKKDRIGAGDDDDAMETERKRVEERMRLRHRNTSKWVKRQLDRKDGDKVAVAEQLRLGQELRRKQQSMLQESDESSDESEAVIRDVANDEKTIKKGLMGMTFMQKAEAKRRMDALALLKEMENKDGYNDNADGKKKGADPLLAGRRIFYGVRENANVVSYSDMEVPSAEDSEEDKEIAKMKSVTEEAEKKLDEKTEERLLSSKLNDAAHEEFEGNRDGFRTVLVGRLAVDLSEKVGKGGPKSPGSKEQGTMKNVPSNEGPKEHRREPTNQEADFSLSDSDFSDEEEASPSRNADEGNFHSVVGSSAPSATLSSKAEVENPWLKPVEREPDAKKKRKKVSESQKRRLPYPEGTGKLLKTKLAINEEGGRSIDKGFSTAPHNVRAVEEPNEKKHEELSQAQKRRRREQQKELDEEEARAMRARMELVARAFAGAGGADEEEFKEAKKKEIEKSLPQAEDVGATVLPGWGAWGGEEVDRKIRKGGWRESSFAKKARIKLEEARKEAKGKRRDGQEGMEHVIISEKRVKGQKRLTLPTAPFPFANAEEWERSIAVPIGKQFLTPKVHRDGLVPKVRKVRGECIAPIRAGKRAIIEKRRQRAKLREDRRKGLAMSVIRGASSA